MDFNEYCGAYKQHVQISKTTSVTTVAGQPALIFTVGGYPAAGSNPANTTTGVVPTDATTGFPPIQNFQSGNKGRLSRVEAYSTVNQVLTLFDVLFWAGPTTIPTSGTTTVALTTRPSFTGRLPFQGDGTTRNWQETELWAWLSTAGSNHAHSVSIDYLDQDGNVANTGNLTTQNIAVNRVLRLPWASGDNGTQDLTGYKVNGATSSSGAVVVAVMRRLWQGRVLANTTAVFGPDMTGLPEVFQDSALVLVGTPEGTATNTPHVILEIAEGT
jgi:hypothetical protein